MSKKIDFGPKTIKYDLNAQDYSPMILGEANELIPYIEKHREQFPNTARFFGDILRSHCSRHPQLEDWLLIIYFQFFRSGNIASLKWIEDKANELIGFIGQDAWEAYSADVLARTDCATTNDLLDRLYDIQLEMSGAIYLGREGWKPGFIPRSDKEEKPDIQGIKDGKKCVLECKFVHTSEKFEAFGRRFDRAAHLYTAPKPPLVLIEQCRFPSSTKIKALTPDDCTLVKKFFGKIYADRENTHLAMHNRGAFAYAYNLEPALVPIDAQYQFARKQGKGFALQYLQRLLKKAASQLGKEEFGGSQKMLFVGLQPDALYLSPWNEPAIDRVKSIFILKGLSQQITVVFSENVDFPVRGYL